MRWGSSSKTVRILVADDHELVRQGLRTVLEAHPGWEVCGEAGTGREAVENAKRLRPDVIVMDLSLPELNGLGATRQILKALPQTEVLVLTAHDSEDIVRKVLEAGARSYISKSATRGDLVAAVEALSRHQPFFTATVSEIILQSYLRGDGRARAGRWATRPLSPREMEIVQLLAEGKTNKEVAMMLGVSVRTVETHRMNIMRKLKLHSLSDLIRYAIRNQIVEP